MITISWKNFNSLTDALMIKRNP